MRPDDDIKKICVNCKIEQPITEFYRNNKQCRACLNKKQRLRRKISNNKVILKYEKTKKGFLMRLYRNMTSRITGVQKAKYHLYQGKELLDKDVFYIWAMNNSIFHILFKNWEDSEYNRKLTPSVDRVDSSKGYNLNNMEWITHSENSKRGSINRKNK